jgi:Zn-dependent peptidase ImmA (M78 family)
MLIMDAARQAAEDVLDEHWDGTFPVNPVDIANRLDIEVKSARFKDAATSGAIIATDVSDVAIYFAEDDPFVRQIFTIAHEIGHFSERRAVSDEEFSFVEKRHPSSYDLHEFYADEFAGNLLMPTREFCTLWNGGKKVQDLAKYFGVSGEAVRKRLERLRKYGELS